PRWRRRGVRGRARPVTPERMTMRTEYTLGVKQEFREGGRVFTYRCGRCGLGSRTRRHWIDVYHEGAFLRTVHVDWDRFAGAPKTYEDYARDAVRAMLSDPDSPLGQRIAERAAPLNEMQ